ncbi:efflux transporter outer membrane subunit [Dysgonomonas sp. Marseille-P4677]|uniref:efflux transporter outer membrane subunit n=1 Tax=Dysgonomonas sp. Marseille-P4677 TaxID=2364790 RepID=UPI0019129949|nr:efflux transporter outer membrane subunit [Dysgonomonas sp. Marseille-P4677]MBK5722666.1 efflux transporter outer membrane subunit [Dysgonomonas sp. Marseille-P4677]
MKMSNFKYILVVVFILLSSCKIGQKYKQPDMPMPQKFEVGNAPEGIVADIGWSTLYADTTLQELIVKALDHNKDMLVAVARIKEMAAKNRISFANLFPEIGGELAGQKEYLNYGGENSKYSPELRANLNISWELDIWGKLRWANEAAVAAYLQTVEAQRALHLTIVSQVAQSYFELMALDRELEIVKQTLEARREGVRFAKLRYEGGLTSEIPYRQSLVELARTETLIPNLENEIKLKENDLFILIGEFPSGTLARGGESINHQQIPQSLPIDLPSSLLKRRPDMVQAEQKLIQANAEVGIAYTEMFPSLKLTGRLGGENTELTDFIKSPTWFIAGVLTGPIFNMGKNKAKHNAAKAVYEQEVYTYEKSVMEAFKEVNNSIVTFNKMKEVYRSQEALYNSAKSYHELAKLQYVNGAISYIDVLDAQRQFFDAEIAMNNAILNELISVVALYKALGGGLNK